jgi:hypothetical protein
MPEGKPLMSATIRKSKPSSVHTAEEEQVEETGFLLEPSKVEVGAAYMLKIDYDQQDNQIVNIKTYGKVDLAKIKQEIQKVFPEAQIRQEPCIITITKKHVKKTRQTKKHK